MAGNTCLHCKKKFEKKRSNQTVCSPDCAYKYIKQQNKRKAAQEQKKADQAWKIKKKKLLPVVHAKKYKKLFQDQINLLARKIDGQFGYLCIDCGKLYGEQTDGAHFHNVKGNENIRFNLHNIHSARSDCNQYSSEHKSGYKIGIEKRYGKDYLELIDFGIPKKYPYLGLNEVEIFEKLTIVRKLNREFEKIAPGNGGNGKEMREYFNGLIGIYT